MQDLPKKLAAALFVALGVAGIGGGFLAIALDASHNFAIPMVAGGAFCVLIGIMGFRSIRQAADKSRQGA
jgi:hypothetical protein